MERTNARTLDAEAIGGPVDLTSSTRRSSASRKLLPAVVRCTRVSGHLVALVKPQFEVGREQASRGKGVVRDEAVRADAIAAVAQDRRRRLRRRRQHDSVLPGPKGNREAFVHARRVEVGDRSPAYDSRGSAAP